MAAVHKSAHTNTVYSHNRPEPAVHQSHVNTNGSCPEQEPLLSNCLEDENRLQWEPLSTGKNAKQKVEPPKFEAFTMTGEYIINISRPHQSIVPKQQKKVIVVL